MASRGSLPGWRNPCLGEGGNAILFPSSGKTGKKRTGVLFYVNGEKDGAQTWYHENGSKSLESNYVNGKEHGTTIRYYENGNKKEETPYLEGKRHGTAIDYYENGMKKEELTSLNGMAHGTAVDYREDGSKWRETVFVKHNRQSEVWYREDGSKWKEMPYNGFVLHGTVVGYYKDLSLIHI